MTLHFNEGFPPQNSAELYAKESRLRLSNVLRHEDAVQATEALIKETPFSTAMFVNDKHSAYTREELKAMPAETLKAMQQELHTNASKGVGYLYDRLLVTGSGKSKSPQILQDFATLLNSDQVLNQVKEMTGHQDIVSASVQASRYLPGHFLTRHNDLNKQEERRVAYVLNLSADWHPDWGGNLQFSFDDGTIRDAWAPQFNCMSLFDVRHVHSVTYVTPFCPQQRVALTGWFRAKPL